MKRRRVPRNVAFSLLEVILAIAILAGAIAVIGEVTRNAMRNARAAAGMAKAQLFCESLMAEIASGLAAPEPVVEAPLDIVVDPNEPDWLYTVETETIDDAGLLAVRVTVRQDLPPEMNPPEVSMTRWITDAEAMLMAGTAEAETTATDTTSMESEAGNETE
ncbi:MAG: hypothetical protein ACOY3P_24785 [Planctomycetota bacterium]